MNHLVDQYFDSLIDKKIAVLGIGVSNRPLIRMLLARGLHVLACDKTPREKLDAEVLELERAGTVLHVGEHYLDDVQADIVFRTPGMHPDIPALRRLREKGAELTSEMEAFFEVCPCRIIAVTGSDGKTTTTTLIAKILEHAGHRVWVGGNIGAPLLPQAADMTPADIAVVDAVAAPEDFNAIGSCIQKEYVYQIYNSRIRDAFLEHRVCFYPQPLDFARLARAGRAFEGTHDFAAVRSVGTETRTTVRTVHWCRAERDGPLISIAVCADGFLYNMVRAIVGTMVYASYGKIEPEAIPALLATRDRRLTGPTMPPQGLYLNRVWYDGAVGDMMNQA